MVSGRKDSVSQSVKSKVTYNDYKSKLKPRTVWDRPEIHELGSGSIKIVWKESSLPQYAVQTEIWYIVEQREASCMDWIKVNYWFLK